ncbi:MAG: hypothetical protein C5B57_09200 [Blastocatellia bacterium]|nr:MAG: hypothetical protein C5B57_09200 [Blastocatellia bacterium]
MGGSIARVHCARTRRWRLTWEAAAPTTPRTSCASCKIRCSASLYSLAPRLCLFRPGHYGWGERRLMPHRLIALASIVVIALLSVRVSSQGLITQRNLSLPMAKTIAEATLAECKSKGFNTAAAVVDRSGQLLVLLRDDQATAQTLEMARRKAYTARMFRMTTNDFQKRTANDPTLAPQRDIADILALGGGVPIQVGTETIGGVGSSGSNQEMDEVCAKAGIAKVAELLK